MISSRYVCKKPFEPTDGMASSLGERKTPTELRVWSLFSLPLFQRIPRTPVLSD